MMRHEPAEAIRFVRLQGHYAVGNPDAFPIEINLTSRGMANDFLGTGARKEWSVQDGQLRVPGWIRNSNRKETGVLVIYVAALDAMVRTKGREPETLPVEQVLR